MDHRETNQTFSRAAERATDQMTRAIGFGGPQFEELARQSSRNVEAVTLASTVLVRGAQDVSREWLELAQSRLQKNLDGFNALTRSRSLQEFAAAHTVLLRDNMQQVIETSRRVADVSVRVANEAARTVANRRLHEAVEHQSSTFPGATRARFMSKSRFRRVRLGTSIRSASLIH